MPISPLSPADQLVESALGDETLRRRQSLLDFFALLRIGRGRQDDAPVVPDRVRERVGRRKGRPDVVLRHEPAVDVTGADAQHEHHRRMARLGKLEPPLDTAHDLLQLRARIEQPDL